MIGIDYSVTSPAVAIRLADGSLKFFCFRQKKKHMVNDDRIVMLDYPEYDSPEDRYASLATGLMEEIDKVINLPTKVHIENYAYSASGQITGLAEATGLMKHHLWLEGCSIHPHIASSVKKFATGKGNATKREMVDAFAKVVADPYPWFDLVDDGKEKIPSPINDIVDAYFVLTYGESLPD